MPASFAEAEGGRVVASRGHPEGVVRLVGRLLESVVVGLPQIANFSVFWRWELAARVAEDVAALGFVFAQLPTSLEACHHFDDLRGTVLGLDTGIGEVAGDLWKEEVSGS